jgi:hypothetical protein
VHKKYSIFSEANSQDLWLHMFLHRNSSAFILFTIIPAVLCFFYLIAFFTWLTIILVHDPFTSLLLGPLNMLLQPVPWMHLFSYSLTIHNSILKPSTLIVWKIFFSKQITPIFYHCPFSFHPSGYSKSPPLVSMLWQTDPVCTAHRFHFYTVSSYMSKPFLWSISF